MANATINNTEVNETEENVVKGPGVSVLDLIKQAENGGGAAVHVVSDVGGNRSVRLKDYDLNLITIRKNGVDGIEYPKAYVPSAEVPEGVHTAQIARGNPDDNTPVGRIEFYGVEFEGLTKGGNKVTSVFATSPVSFYAGDSAPDPVYEVVEDVSRLALTKKSAVESADVASSVQADAAPEGTATSGAIKLRGALFVQKGSEQANLRSEGKTIPVAVQAGALNGYIPRTFKSDVVVETYDVNKGGKGVEYFAGVSSSGISQVVVDEGKTLADYPDGVVVDGLFTVTREGAQKDGVGSLQMESERYPGLKFNIKTGGGRGVMPVAWAATSKVGDVIEVRDSYGKVNGWGVLLENPWAGNLTQRDAVLAQKASDAAANAETAEAAA